MGTSKQAERAWSLPGRADRAYFALRTFHANYSWQTCSSWRLIGLRNGRRMIRIGAGARHPDAIDIAMYDVDRNAVAFAEKRRELIRDHHGTMPAPRAPNSYRQVTFSFAFETW